MKKILLLDPSVATINVGDEIIKCSIEKNFPELYEDNYIYRLPTHTHTFSRLQLLVYPQKKKDFANADLKFLCGTNALYVNMLRPMPTWNINFFNTSLIKGTICLGVGAGRNATKPNLYTRKLYDKVLSHDYIHSVRDEFTEELLHKMGFSAVNTGCPTLWGLNDDHCSKIPQKKSERAIFSLTSYTPDLVNDKKLIQILYKNYEEVYFWPQSINDIEYLKSITTKVPNIIPPNLKAYDSILKEECDYIGNRLHGGIYAMQHYRRSIIIAIDNRARDMGNSYSIPVIERAQTEQLLDNMINTQWKTKISGLDFAKIEEWKNQFFS